MQSRRLSGFNCPIKEQSILFVDDIIHVYCMLKNMANRLLLVVLKEISFELEIGFCILDLINKKIDN